MPVPSDAATSAPSAEGGTSWGRAYALPVVLAVIGALGASGAVKLAGVNVPWVVILLVFLAAGTAFFLGARFVLREIAERREAAYRRVAELDRRLRASEERYLSNAEIAEVKRTLAPFVADREPSEQVSTLAAEISAEITDVPGDQLLRIARERVASRLEELLALIRGERVKASYPTGER